MPRRPRVTLPNIPQHIIQRGNNRQACFYAEADYRAYLTYDADRNLIAVTDPMNQVTRYSYYPTGKRHTQTDPDGNVTTWTRDLEGRVIAKTYADGNHTDYVFDSANRLVGKTDALSQITHYAYTIADRLKY